MSCDPWAPIRRRWRPTPCSGHSAPWSSVPCWRWASPWRSRHSCRSVRPVRSTRHRGSPSTGPCCCPVSRCSSLGLGGLTIVLAYRGSHATRPRTAGVRAAVRGGRRRRPVRVARTRACRSALLARAWPRSHRRARPLGAHGRRAGGGGRGGDPHLRKQSRHPRLPPRPLRLELELCHQLPRHQQRSAGRRAPPQSGPGRGRVDRVHVRQCADQRPHRPRAVDPGPRRPRSADPHRARGRRRTTRWSSARPPSPLSTRRSATPSWSATAPRRTHPSTSLRHPWSSSVRPPCRRSA